MTSPMGVPMTAGRPLRTAGGRAHGTRVSTASLEAMADDVLLAPVAAARSRIQNPRELSERVAFGKALWRELVIGFAAQLGELRLGFTQLAALYVVADGGTTTIADLADTINRSPSATSRLVDGLVRRRLLERREEPDDRRMKSVWLTERGRALLGLIDRARADQFLAVVRPLPANERAIVAMGVAALATRAVSRRGRLIKQRPL
jgi:DNA-binding MarR family transcriptional regulator